MGVGNFHINIGCSCIDVPFLCAFSLMMKGNISSLVNWCCQYTWTRTFCSHFYAFYWLKSEDVNAYCLDIISYIQRQYTWPIPILLPERSSEVWTCTDKHKVLCKEGNTVADSASFGPMWSTIHSSVVHRSLCIALPFLLKSYRTCRLHALFSLATVADP